MPLPQMPGADLEMTGRLSPGWYPDPTSRFRFRWWDGQTWTRHTLGRVVAYVRASRRRALFLILLGIPLLILSLIGGVGGYLKPEYAGLLSHMSAPFHTPGSWSGHLRPGVHAVYSHSSNGGTLRLANIQIRSGDGGRVRLFPYPGSSYERIVTKTVKFVSVAKFSVEVPGTYTVAVKQSGFTVSVGLPVGTDLSAGIEGLLGAGLGLVMLVFGVRGRSGRFGSKPLPGTKG